MNHRNTFKEETLLARKHLKQLETLANKLDTLDEQWELIIGQKNPGYMDLYSQIDKLKRNLHENIGVWRQDQHREKGV
ncbi:hypothetical protein OOY87_004275 [Escherichia coli]|nr:hypothetical protein [Escherichia coli]